MAPPLLGSLGLDAHYDLVVVGTSLGPSVVAAATAATGRTVLHLDANEYYGGLDDATFTLDEAIQWAQRLEEEQPTPNVAGESDGEGLLGSIALQLARTRRQKAAISAAAAVAADNNDGDSIKGDNAYIKPPERTQRSLFDKSGSKPESAGADYDEELVRMASDLRPRLRLQHLVTEPTRAARLLSYTKEEEMAEIAVVPLAVEEDGLKGGAVGREPPTDVELTKGQQ